MGLKMCNLFFIMYAFVNEKPIEGLKDWGSGAIQ